jgi:hypothetical protein
MTKAELIKDLEQYPDDMLTAIWDTEREMFETIDDIDFMRVKQDQTNDEELWGKRVIVIQNKGMLNYHNLL